MNHKRFRIKTSIFYLAIGAAEFVTGLIALYNQGAVERVVSGPFTPLAGHLPTFLLIGGISSFISHSYPHLPRPVTGLLTCLAAVPLIVISLSSAFTTHYFEALVFATLFISVLSAPFFRHHLFLEIEEEPIDFVVLSLSSATLLLSFYSLTKIANAQNLLPEDLMTTALFATSFVLLTVSFFAQRLISLLVRGLAVAPAFFIFGSFAKPAWPEIFFTFWTVLALAAVIETFLKNFVFSHDYPISELSKEKRAYFAFVSQIEVIIWIIGLLIIWFASYTSQVAMNKNSLFVIIAATSLSAILFFHLLPPSHLGKNALLSGTVFYSLVIFLIVYQSGNLESPFSFIFFFAILAASYLLPPKFISIPVVFAAFSLLYSGLTYFSSNPGLEAAFRTSALVAEKGLALAIVSYLSYLLVNTQTQTPLPPDPQGLLSKETREVLAIEEAIERITWLIILMMGVGAFSEISLERKFLSLLLVVIFAIATVVWYHILPKIMPSPKINKTRLLSWTILFSTFSALVVLTTGGNESRYVFILLLPILASSLTLKSYLLIAPFWITTFALCLDWIAKLYALGPVAFGSKIAFVSAINFTTIVFVAFLAYRLAQTREKHSL